jgi:hypothetical protein
MHSQSYSYFIYTTQLLETGATTSVTSSSVRAVYITKTLLSRAAAIKALKLKLLKALKALIKVLKELTKVMQSRALKVLIKALADNVACAAATSSKPL